MCMFVEGTLGEEYVRCANRAQDRNAQRRDNSLQTLTMPDGRNVVFGKAARKNIPSEVIKYIRYGVNGMPYGGACKSDASLFPTAAVY